MIRVIQLMFILCFIMLLSSGLAYAKLKREFIYKECFQFDNDTSKDPFNGDDDKTSDDPFTNTESDEGSEDKDDPFSNNDSDSPFGNSFKNNDSEQESETKKSETNIQQSQSITENEVRQIVNEILGLSKFEWRGYFENQLSGGEVNKRFMLQDYNKLRLELITTTKESDSDETYSNLNVAMIGQTFHGQRSINALDYIPTKFSSIIDPNDRDSYLFSFEDDYRLEVGEIVFNTGRLQVRVGKLMLKSGTGYFFNPTDVFMQKNPSDPGYETPGIPAMTAEYFLEYDPPASVGAMLAFDETFRYSTKLVFLKYFFRFGDELTADTKVQFASRDENYLKDYQTFEEQLHRLDQLGFDVHFNLLGFGLGFEIAYNMSTIKDSWLVALSQIDYTFENGVSLIVEHYYDESGKSDEAEYTFNDWMAYIFGARLTMAQHYLAFSTQYEASLNLTLSMSGFLNISDESAALIPRVDYVLLDGIQLNAYAVVPIGSSETEFGSQSTQFILRLRYSFTSK